MGHNLLGAVLGVSLTALVITIAKRLVDDRIEAAANAAIDTAVGPGVSRLLPTPHGIAALVLASIIARQDI